MKKKPDNLNFKEEVEKQYPIEKSLKIAHTGGVIEIALPLGLIYMGYLFYEKNILLSILLSIIGLILTCIVIGYELKFKEIRHRKPHDFEEYKGE